MVTTIQLNEDLKRDLERLKDHRFRTYEDVIIELIRANDNQKRSNEELLAEGCEAMAEENLKITEHISVYFFTERYVS